ncbi:MAG: hypothetical protein ACPG7F_11700 [Aggregatilineales bacterium]
MQLPMVYVSRDKEYHQLMDEQPPTAEALNTLAKEGWSLLQILWYDEKFYAYLVR